MDTPEECWRVDERRSSPSRSSTSSGRLATSQVEAEMTPGAIGGVWEKDEEHFNVLDLSEE